MQLQLLGVLPETNLEANFPSEDCGEEEGEGSWSMNLLCDSQ